jgi:hypothetical protein
MSAHLVAVVVFVGATLALPGLAGYWIYFNTHRTVNRARATGRASMPYYTRAGTADLPISRPTRQR